MEAEVPDAAAPRIARTARAPLRPATATLCAAAATVALAMIALGFASGGDTAER